MNLVDRVAELEQAIRKHRSQRADDRCIEDDDELYAVLADGIRCDRRIGSKWEMLKNCARFGEHRCQEGGWPTYQELETKIDRQKTQLDAVELIVDENLPEEYRLLNLSLITKVLQLVILLNRYRIGII